VDVRMDVDRSGRRDPSCRLSALFHRPKELMPVGRHQLLRLFQFRQWRIDILALAVGREDRRDLFGEEISLPSGWRPFRFRWRF